MNKKETSFFCRKFFVLSFIISLMLGNVLLYCVFLENREDKANNVADSRYNEVLIKFKNSQELKIKKIKETENFFNALANIEKLDSVEYAEPNFSYQASLIPSDSYFGQQWHLQKIGARDAWNITTKSDAIIAVIDSGVQVNHPDLKDNIWVNTDEKQGNNIDDDKNGFIDDVNGWDFVNNIFDPSPKFSSGFTEDGVLHGTIVAGVIAASGNNAAGVSGAVWRAKIMPLKSLDDKGAGNTLSVVRAIDYAIANGADIINLSFVGLNFSQSLDDAIRRAYKAGIIIVAAAGNEEGEGDGYFLDKIPMYPACNDGKAGENMVIGVVATDAIDQKASFSSYGNKCVDIAAPGVNIFSTSVYSPNNKYGNKFFDKYYDGYWSGTSMATPIVSGALALVSGVNPDLNSKEITDILLKTSDNINKLNPHYENQLGAGRVNAYNAVSAAGNLLNKRNKIIFAPYSGSSSAVRTVEYKSSVYDASFYAYAENFRGGVSLATGDINNDGLKEVITGAGPSGGPHVRIFNQKGELLNQFFAFDKNYRSGVSVAACDIDDDGSDEVVAGMGPGVDPLVGVYEVSGRKSSQFYAYSRSFRGGVNVACGDVNGDGEVEIVTAPRSGLGPLVTIFNKNGETLKIFNAYDKNFRGGVFLSLGNVVGGIRNKKMEIIVGAGLSGGPHVRIFDNNANVLGQFFAYDKSFRGGVIVSSGDVDSDGLAEIITAPGPGGPPNIKIFETSGKILDSFLGAEEKFVGGLVVNHFSF